MDLIKYLTIPSIARELGISREALNKRRHAVRPFGIACIGERHYEIYTPDAVELFRTPRCKQVKAQS
jgi:hypothetical protein